MSDSIWDAKQWICWGYSKDGRKIPCDIFGNISASNRFEDFVSQDVAIHSTQTRKELGLAFCFTAYDQFVGIDLDDCIDVQRSMVKPWAMPIQERFSHCYQEVSPSRTGIKIYCRGSIEEFGSHRVSVGDGTAEIYDRDRFFAVTMLRCGLVDHDKTPLAQEALDWFREAYFPKQSAPKTGGQSIEIDESSLINRVFSSAIAESATGRNNACFAMSCQLRDNGVAEPKAIEIARLFSEQTTKPDNPFPIEEAERCVRSAYRKEPREPWQSFDLPPTKANLVSPDFYVDSPEGDGDRRLQPSIAESETRKIDVAGDFPLRVFRDRSKLIDDFLTAYERSASFVQPQLGLAAALTLCSTMISRKLVSSMGFTANLYSCCVAPTASGKNAPRGLLKHILLEADAVSLLGGEKFASGVAIAKALQHHPVQLFLLDEFGLALRAATAVNAGGHLREIVEMLLAMFSSSDSLWQGKIYADPRNNITVYRPHAVLYASTSPEQLWQGITSQSISNGLLGRMLLFKGDYVPRNEKASDSEVPENIIDWVKQWHACQPAGDLSDDHQCDAEFRVIQLTEAAKERALRHMDTICERRMSEDLTRAAIWSRCAEKAGRIALCVAASRAMPDEAIEIDLEDVEASIRLANYTTRQMCEAAADEIADSDFSRDCLRALKHIRRRQQRGQKTTMRDMYRGLRMTARYVAEIITVLVHCGEIQIDNETGEIAAI